MPVAPGKCCCSSIIAGQDKDPHISMKESLFITVLSPNGSSLSLPKVVVRNISNWRHTKHKFQGEKCWISSELNSTSKDYLLSSALP